MTLSHDRDAWVVHSAPSTASRFPSPVTHGGGLGCGFPSPCGDVVLKSRVLTSMYEALDDKFPSPCGDVVLKSKKQVAKTRGYAWFPSPCGDVVLKLEDRAWLLHRDGSGFRPLAGMWF